MRLFLTLMIIGAVSCNGIKTNSSKNERPIVGVIRWDGYNGSPKWTQEQEFGFLKPKEYHWLAPWFVRRTGEPDKPLKFNPEYRKDIIQSVTDREIKYAADAGIDYFAFCHYGKHKDNGWQLRDNLEAYINSPLKSRIHFSLICIGEHVGAGLINGATGPDLTENDWKAYVREYITLISEKTYQRVLNNRPLFFIFGPKALSTQLGDKKESVKKLRAAIIYLRKELQKKNLGNPYVVGMNAGGIWSEKYIDEAGLDAVSAYRGCFGATTKGTPYSKLSKNIRKQFLEENKKREIIVPLLSGANHLPRHKLLPKKFSANHYLEPKPGELAKHVKFGLDWVNNHPKQCPARSVLIYAWNEHSEGGFLCPLMGESPEYIPNTSQLDELAKALKNWK